MTDKGGPMIASILADIDNQTTERQSGCLSMQSERELAAEIRRLVESLQLIATLNGQPTAQDIARMTLAAQQ